MTLAGPVRVAGLELELVGDDVHLRDPDAPGFALILTVEEARKLAAVGIPAVLPPAHRRSAAGAPLGIRKRL